MMGPSDGILARLQEVARRDIGDFMTFEVGPDENHPEIQNDGMPYDGLRFRAECKLAGKLYGQRFGVDVVFGDPILGEPDVVVAEDVLAFAGIAPPCHQGGASLPGAGAGRRARRDVGTRALELATSLSAAPRYAHEIGQLAAEDPLLVRVSPASEGEVRVRARALVRTPSCSASPTHTIHL